MRYHTLKAIGISTAALLSLCAIQNAHAALLVLNPGFEDLTGTDSTHFSAGQLLDGHLSATANPTSNPLTYVTPIPVPSWTADTPSGGTMNPTAAFMPPGPLDGQNVAYSSGSIVAQTMSWDIEPSTHYTLTVGVGHPDIAGIGFVYHTWLSSGGLVLGEDANTVPISLGIWGTSTVSWDSPASVPAGTHLTINLASNSGVALFDNVQMVSGTVAPEPATLSLLLAPLATLIHRRRR